MKKFIFNYVTDLKHASATVIKMNSFIYCKIVKPVKNTYISQFSRIPINKVFIIHINIVTIIDERQIHRNLTG